MPLHHSQHTILGEVQHHKGVSIMCPYVRSTISTSVTKVGQAPPSVSHVRSPLLTLHRELSVKVWKLGCTYVACDGHRRTGGQELNTNHRYVPTNTQLQAQNLKCSTYTSAQTYSVVTRLPSTHGALAKSTIRGS